MHEGPCFVDDYRHYIKVIPRKPGGPHIMWKLPTHPKSENEENTGAKNFALQPQAVSKAVT